MRKKDWNVFPAFENISRLHSTTTFRNAPEQHHMYPCQSIRREAHIQMLRTGSSELDTDYISARILPFTVGQVQTIYKLGDNINAPLVGLALLFIVGPAEEIFWRGTFQRKLSEFWGKNWGFIGMLICYSLIHIWSFNFMLVMAAAVAGGFQGLVYRLFPKSLWALIVSHALWDVAVFLVFPI